MVVEKRKKVTAAKRLADAMVELAKYRAKDRTSSRYQRSGTLERKTAYTFSSLQKDGKACRNFPKKAVGCLVACFAFKKIESMNLTII